jgi:DNA polymerase zeta
LYLFRQLALKFFMNVMYGYCGASFSGRMPSGDIADSVVELGRTVMNQCIQFINAHPAWRAEVLYGDTDSLFVVLRGRSNAEAHALGNEIAKEITSHYPYPMELKFEKVYNPMFLVAKKRYVGYKHERPTDTPTFEGKGIELIRRDGCPAVVKIMKKVLLTIFDTRDLSQVKAYLQKHWSKILNGHYTLNDFVIAKEVKLGKYANLLPAHAIVATKEMQKDPMK